MDKETEIQEATKIISDTVIKLFNAGYRKADEVRKETAKEIALEINKIINAPYTAYWLGRNIMQMIKNKYGVEVDE